ncbi:MAG: HEAT repeat domain-containing protein [Cyanobacteria bacterium J06648_16]
MQPMAAHGTDWVSRAKGVTEVEQALLILSEGDFHGRWEVVKRFPDVGQSSVAPLLAIARDPDRELESRWFAVRSLGRFTTPQAIAALAQLVAEVDEDDLSVLAAEQLAGMGSQAVAALIPLLDHPLERPLAVRALAQIRQRAVIEPLLSVVTDTDSQLRQTAIEALGSFHDPRVTAVLLAALDDPSAAVRREAITALGHRHDLCGTPDLLMPLQDCLWDIDLAVCCQAAIALGRLPLPQTVPSLEKLLAASQTPESLLLHAVRSLTWIDTETALTVLLECYEGLPAIAQLEILRRLRQMTTARTRSVNFLRTLLQDTSRLPTEIKQAAALSLGQLGDETTFLALVPLLADPNQQVQFHCLRALEQLTPHDLAEQLQAVLDSGELPVAVQASIEAHLAAW